jgi:membrane fusion protein (multidrug efflux system)
MKTRPSASILIANLAGLVLLSGCTEKIESDPQTASLEAARPSLASAPAAGREAGYPTYLYSERDVDVFNRLGGGGFYEQGVVVEKIHVEVGDRVEAGQLLATLEDDEVVIRVEAAQAKVDHERANFERVEEMRQRDVISQAQYDQALASKRLAEAEFKRAQLDLTRTRVRAPFSGVVARRYVREGQVVDLGVSLFRVTAMTPLRARLLVPEAESADFAIGSAVELRGANSQTATARVLVISPTIDAGSGTREVVVELTEPDGFRPGAAVVAKPLPLREGQSP